MCVFVSYLEFHMVIYPKFGSLGLGIPHNRSNNSDIEAGGTIILY